MKFFFQAVVPLALIVIPLICSLIAVLTSVGGPCKHYLLQITVCDVNDFFVSTSLIFRFHEIVLLSIVRDSMGNITYKNP